MAIEIKIKNTLNNTSLQIGDTAYFTTPAIIGATTNTAGANIHSGINEGGDIKKIGEITAINFGINTITIDNPNQTPDTDDFIMFSKNTIVNNTSLLGYYAEVQLKNDSEDKAELFSLASEVTPSSK